MVLENLCTGIIDALGNAAESIPALSPVFELLANIVADICGFLM